ncbi:acyl-CoA dehydrogenase [Halioglobus japonicus]|uniref:3-methylmercaptopropionyl-CoA dehydrogenase n=1 Tax=Halioglobus japonicus TaxID=930805 RepID=A0AAP8MGU0_9GAMM|nr:acyl-CoA dehydrogenase C-terminal domain-containing protein [Halioglobus japonicus]AQA19522.1 acyl-CoA dehydrogenase [Halioglobus japonicus]PLW87414.1 acyl-CoA dehydrogenase [Halioglobus japonicus]GHD08605.1 acyl-CoA dehydrogenase [Halioglobus japonicus]
MPDYRAPLTDMAFVNKELLGMDHYQQLDGCEPLTEDLWDAIVDGGAKFAENVLAPLNRNGDEQGCDFDNGQVSTPEGFAEAFRQYGEAGWQSLSIPTDEGGQGLPGSMSTLLTEMTAAANYAWSMYPGLAHAPITCIRAGGTEAQKATYLPKLYSLEWAGTMCLTESHCGSDVGLLRTKANPNGDGSYTITGTKIFISGGEQDITENIIHAVLARVEGAPEGTSGISLFLVPKVMVNDDGSLGERNAVHCGSIEHKMGIKGSATCVMNFDGATGFLLGEENRGLEVMFKIMNTARLGTALQGVCLGEAAFQGALAYARERLQMRALSGVQNPDGPADPIIAHPDVRRMLMTQKALIEGSRAFIHWLSRLNDLTQYGSEEQAAEADDLMSLLTPIAKAFCTETGVEVTNLGVQVFGGHGYIREHGMEQLLRDMRIATIYEGTTGIQSLDLLGRKVMGSGGKLLRNFTKRVHKFCEAQAGNSAISEFIEPLAAVNAQWGEITMQVGEKAMENADEIGAASVDYTLFGGYVALAYMWAQMAEIALQQDGDFYTAKLATARFYFQRILPRAEAHARAAVAGAGSVMDLEESLLHL